jgi:hypothetical protein
MSISNEFIYWSDVENKADQGVDFLPDLQRQHSMNLCQMMNARLLK